MSSQFQNVVYKYPDIWVCPYEQYGCDNIELEEECVDSAWMTEGGVPDAVFYPREKLNHTHQVATEQLQIEAVPVNTEEVSRSFRRPFRVGFRLAQRRFSSTRSLSL